MKLVLTMICILIKLKHFEPHASYFITYKGLLNFASHNIYRHNKETSALHLCFSKRMQIFHSIILLQEMWLFNNAPKKIIRYSFTTTITPQAPVPKFRKSHNQYLAYLPFAFTTAAHACLTEWTSCWIVMNTSVFLAATTAGISLSRKLDVTEFRSRPWVVIADVRFWLNHLWRHWH